jgi:hypothetical protein
VATPRICAGAISALLLGSPATGWAEWQIKPFLGATFGGDTTFIANLEEAAGQRNLTVGVSGVLLSNVIGIEVDAAHAPGYFQGRTQDLVLDSGVTTLTGNVFVTLPRGARRYGLGPYAVGGFGLVRSRVDPTLEALALRRTLPAFDVGGGVTGFLTNRIGLNWDVRYLRSFHGDTGTGTSYGQERISMWRATMGVVIGTNRKAP